jgi:hypothetical protein
MGISSFQGFWCLSGGAGSGEERGGEERSHEAHQVGKLQIYLKSHKIIEIKIFVFST